MSQNEESLQLRMKISLLVFAQSAYSFDFALIAPKGMHSGTSITLISITVHVCPRNGKMRVLCDK